MIGSTKGEVSYTKAIFSALIGGGLVFVFLGLWLSLEEGKLVFDPGAHLVFATAKFFHFLPFLHTEVSVVDLLLLAFPTILVALIIAILAKVIYKLINR
ncbi:MAG: hypothetical protein Q8P13_02240 [bacterium]|nr:hypothetical protein [bacterium]